MILENFLGEGVKKNLKMPIPCTKIKIKKKYLPNFQKKNFHLKLLKQL
jgi:hypothetical protein